MIATLPVLAGCQRPARKAARAQLLTVAHGRYATAWERRFNPFRSDPLWSSRAGIYERLIINTMTGE